MARLKLRGGGFGCSHSSTSQDGLNEGSHRRPLPWGSHRVVGRCLPSTPSPVVYHVHHERVWAPSSWQSGFCELWYEGLPRLL